MQNLFLKKEKKSGPLPANPRESTFILPTLRERTFIMGKMKVRTLILALSIKASTVKY